MGTTAGRAMHRGLDADVAIAGAGPAGAQLALRLARAGRRVLLVDRARFPREKPCGEFLSPECLPLLEELGLREELLAAGARPVAGMRLHGFGRAARGGYARIGRAQARFDHGWGIRREILDELALRAAEREPLVRALLGWRVSGVLCAPGGRARGLALRDPQGRRVEARARFVVGADGTQSRVARSLGWHARDPRLDRWALVARFEGVPALSDAEVHFFDGGYFAACSVDGGLFTINLVAERARLAAGGGTLEERFLRAVAGVPSLAPRLAGARPCAPVRACGPLASRALRTSAPGVALVGDAAGFVDPLTGEGLFFAMRGAALLAEAILVSLADPSSEERALRAYERARRREIAPRHAAARLLQRGIAHPRLAARALALLAARPGLADLAVAWTGDYVAPRELLRPGVWVRALA